MIIKFCPQCKQETNHNGEHPLINRNNSSGGWPLPPIINYEGWKSYPNDNRTPSNPNGIEFPILPTFEVDGVDTLKNVSKETRKKLYEQLKKEFENECNGT